MSEQGEIDEALAACPLFAGVQREGRAELAALAVQRRYEAGQTVFLQDTLPPGVFVVQQGRVRVYRLSPTGREHVLHICEPPQTFAEVAVLGDFRLPACAAAMQATTCVLLPREPLLAALRADHGLCLQLIGGMAHWVRHLVGLLEDVVLRDAMGRVARYLLENAEPEGSDGAVVEFRAPKQAVANHLNLTGATLSRVLRRLEEAELIENPDPRMTRLVDVAGLREVIDAG